MQIGKSRVLALLAAASIIASACGSTAATASPQAGSQAPVVTPAPVATPAAPVADVYPRAETLYTAGKQWGPPSTWNPLDSGNYAMGVIGLQYETMFMYDPLKDVYTPWLATKDSGWDATKTTYTIKVRDGVKWSDGSALTSADVKFSIDVMKNPILNSNLFTYVTDVSAPDASTVVVKFNNPAYQEWAQFLYQQPIVPAAVFSTKNDANILKFTNENGVGTGPYTYKTHADDRMVWQKNPTWWATAALGLDVKPKYIVDIVNSSNNVALGQLIQNTLDLNNNFLPGIASLVTGGYNITTYFPKAPFMLAGNTAVLIPNVAKKPLDDPAFRKALATAINEDDIVQKVYGNIVTKSDPTGLLPIFDKYIDHAQVSAIGTSYNTAKAKAILAAAGYKTVNGAVVNKDGTAIKLVLEVPDGWSDWMQAETSIANSAKAAGITIDPQHPDFNTVVADRNRPDAGGAAKFDLIINNDVQVGNTPWTWYDYVFRLQGDGKLPNGTAETRNFEGYVNPDAWKLVQKLDATPIDDLTTMKSLSSQLQKIQLTDMPVIPLWYNGIWSQVNNSTWTNFPSDGGTQVMPATWNGYWNMGAVLMLTQIKPVTK
jgi:peptide/nickel transport system substrate-binding protein